MHEIDPSVVDKAEELRQVANTAKDAREVANIAEFAFKMFSEDDIAAISKNPTQKLILACLMRIDVDARKTAANKEMKPVKSFTDLEVATNTITEFYRNPSLEESLRDEEFDHLGRPHSFLAEMPRDEAKVAESAADFYKGEERKHLFKFAIDRLEETANKLPEGHPTKSLIRIEIQLLGEIVGETVDEDQLLLNMLEVADTSEDNPHRIATVSAWVQSYAERHDNEELRKKASALFESFISGRDDWRFIMRDARLRPEVKKVRAMLFGNTSDIYLSATQKRSLFENLTEKYV